MPEAQKQLLPPLLLPLLLLLLPMLLLPLLHCSLDFQICKCWVLLPLQMSL